jgi:2-polyprenyl-3-methyl-5-hydroxy-6-metoxy-1,4-benzoquinol methylase
MVDINTFREDTPKSWFRVKADARNLPFRDSCFDVVSSTEMLEHVPSDGWQKVLDELYRVSKNLVYITTSDYTQHLGEEQKRIEQLNPFSKYQDFPKEELFVTNGFHILFASQHRIIAFKRKISEWNSCFKDMEAYVRQVCGNMQITSVMDVGTGLKGVVAQDFWEKRIKEGFAVDAWKIKPLSAIWKPMLIDALQLEDFFKPKSIDVIQAFGFLEHLEKIDGFKFLQTAEQIGKKLVIVSAATFNHGYTPDYKVKIDGNPYHIYRSTWHWKEFESLGYTTNYEDMKKGVTFSEEAIAWKLL